MKIMFMVHFTIFNQFFVVGICLEKLLRINDIFKASTLWHFWPLERLGVLFFQGPRYLENRVQKKKKKN